MWQQEHNWVEFCADWSILHTSAITELLKGNWSVFSLEWAGGKEKLQVTTTKYFTECSIFGCQGFSVACIRQNVVLSLTYRQDAGIHWEQLVQCTTLPQLKSQYWEVSSLWVSHLHTNTHTQTHSSNNHYVIQINDSVIWSHPKFNHTHSQKISVLWNFLAKLLYIVVPLHDLSNKSSIQIVSIILVSHYQNTEAVWVHLTGSETVIDLITDKEICFAVFVHWIS